MKCKMRGLKRSVSKELRRKVANTPEISIRGQKLRGGLSDNIEIGEKENVIGLYQRNFPLDRSIYRIVERKTYKHRFAYKVYNKKWALYQLYSPFFNEFITL